MFNSDFNITHLRLLPADKARFSVDLSLAPNAALSGVVPKAVKGRKRADSWFTQHEYFLDTSQGKMADLWLKITDTRGSSGHWHEFYWMFLQSTHTTFNEKGDTW